MILLDTNALLWLLSDSARLGATSRARLTSGEQVCYSAVSVVEIEMKAMLGKLQPPSPVTEAVRSAGLSELAMTGVHAEHLRDFPALAAQDPFDRMIVAQAAAESATLVTSDARLLGLGERWLLDARR